MTLTANKSWSDQSHVVMVRPAAFCTNQQTADSNSFQAPNENAHPQEKALHEFDSLIENLLQKGVDVAVFEGNQSTRLPDEVFANNWISTHPNGKIVIHPMLAENRRAERRLDIPKYLQSSRKYGPTEIVDLSYLEPENEYLEGTGSLVIDHSQNLAWCALSARSTQHALNTCAQRLGLNTIAFATNDGNGVAIYHTNVLLSITPNIAIVCLAVIDDHDRQRVYQSLEQTDRKIMPISPTQMRAFCGNMLYLKGAKGPILAMSTSALAAFTPDQRHRLEQEAELVPTAVNSIQSIGGGGVRCMLTEVLLDRVATPNTSNIESRCVD